MENNEQLDSNFDFIKEHCNESKMFRNNFISQMTLRDVADSVFLNMLTLYLLSQEFETAPFAQEYAHKTSMFGNFSVARVGGTDLYQGLHILLNPSSRTSQLLHASEQNALLTVKLKTNSKMVKDFLRGIAGNSLDSTTAIRLMYRLEGQMHIDISNYKSLRRLITDWHNLSTEQRKLCVTRLLQYYRVRGRRSELFPALETVVQNKGWELNTAGNAELEDVGAGAIVGTRSPQGFLKGVAKVGAGAIAGWAFGKLIS